MHGQTDAEAEKVKQQQLATPRLGNDPEDETLNFGNTSVTSNQDALLPGTARSGSSNEEPTLQLIETSKFRANLHKQLISVYEPLETWYLRSSVEKAHNLDEADFSSRPFLSSSLDDAFFILKKVLLRVVTASSLPTHRRMCAEISTIMERDFSDILRRRMDSVWAGISSTSQSARTKEEVQARQTFIVSRSKICTDGKQARDDVTTNTALALVPQVYANDLDMAADYVSRLVDEIFESGSLSQSFFLTSEYETAKASLETVKALQDRFRASLKVRARVQSSWALIRSYRTGLAHHH